MAPITSMKNAWSLLTELDTRSLREQVQTPFPIVILGRDPQARQWLTDALRTDPATQKRLRKLMATLQKIPLQKGEYLQSIDVRNKKVHIEFAKKPYILSLWDVPSAHNFLLCLWNPTGRPSSSHWAGMGCAVGTKNTIRPYHTSSPNDKTTAGYCGGFVNF